MLDKNLGPAERAVNSDLPEFDELDNLFSPPYIAAMDLATYLQNQDRTAAWFSRQIGATPGAVTRWLKGERYPNQQSIEAIYRATGGMVGPRDFNGRAA